jgi:DNA-binding transcriptional LysR family regulator
VKNIESLSDATVGEVRVGTHSPMLAGLLPAIFDRLHRKYPGISVHAMPVPTDAQQFRSLRERRIDLLLGRMTLPMEEDIHTEVLFLDRAVVVAGPKSKWGRRQKIELAELSEESWCLPLTDREIGLRVADAFRASGANYPPRGVLWGAGTVMLALIPRGPYLSIGAASLLRFGVNLPRLKVLPVNLPIPPWQVGVMTLKNRTLTPAVKLFLDCAREVVKPLAKTIGNVRA